MGGVGQNYKCTVVYTALWAGKSPIIQPYTVCVYTQSWPNLSTGGELLVGGVGRRRGGRYV